jgi:hypothetical protein
VKWYGKYRRKVGWKVKWYEKYGRKPSWIVKRYGKCFLHTDELFKMIIQDNGFYLTFCTFSFKFKESSLSYAKCGITTPLIKEWHDFARDVLMHDLSVSDLFLVWRFYPLYT